MYRFWDSIIEPALDRVKPDVIVEVGSDLGFNTRNLLEYARRSGARLHVIDPLPKYDVEEWQANYPDTLVFHLAPSLDVLTSIHDADVVLIDGDHNWHTVFHELKSLEKLSGSPGEFPLVFLHDVGWPYGRRDLYYEPDRIPAPHRQPYQEAGVRPDRETLDPDGGFNSHLFNATREGGPRNGVLTAVEDFLEETDIEMRLVRVPGINDLGILFPASMADRNKEFAALIDEITGSPPLNRLLSRVEALRIEALISGCRRAEGPDDIEPRSSNCAPRSERGITWCQSCGVRFPN